MNSVSRKTEKCPAHQRQDQGRIGIVDRHTQERDLLVQDQIKRDRDHLVRQHHRRQDGETDKGGPAKPLARKGIGGQGAHQGLQRRADDHHQ
ncbi:hypothetical protein QW131_32345 [Roseibium salinum]|nr:hypothetical protein [Roseibium salinum]